MIRMMIVFALLMLGSFAAQAQPVHPEGWRDNERPRWCAMYSQRDYWREVRACGDDRQCRWHARRKAERCGLKG
jgi:hypothetical protein